LNDFVAFSSGLTMLLIAIIYGVAAAVFSHSKSNSIFYRDTYHLKILFAFFVVFIIAHIDFFAYKKILFSIILITIICTIQIIFLNTNFPISLFAIRKRTTLVCFFTVILLTLSMSFLAASKETKVVAWPVDRGVWANTEEKYGTNDWTLKSSYSYSLLKEFMERKYQVENITDLSNLDPAKEDAVFFITPTLPFSANEVFALDHFVRNGGKAVFLLDHTDLYGHARVANAYLQKYGINAQYDAVFAPENPYKSNLLNDMFCTWVRPMTGCSLEIYRNGHIRSFFLGNIAEKADYTKPNFFSDKAWTADDIVGIFPFWVVKRVGKGSISVCSDSTIFSNFALFQPKVLTLVRGLFQWDYILTFLTDLYPYFLILSSLLLLFAYIAKKYLQVIYFVLFLSLLLPTKAFILFDRNTEAFYPSQKICYIESKKEFIYEPEEPGSISWRFSISNLLSNLPRFGIYPYYIDNIEKYFSLKKIDLIVSDNECPKLQNTQKAVIVNKIPKDSLSATQDIVYANPCFSDYYLGTWWTSLEISPFRKVMSEEFSEWLSNDEKIDEFKYPPVSIKPGSKELQLKNERSKIKKILYSRIVTYHFKGQEYVYFGQGIWGIVVEKNNKTYFLGGPSLNDRIAEGFYGTNWYGVLEK
jgi:hypothetical protein